MTPPTPPTPPTMDLNADLGEDPAHLARDLELLTLVTSANIACGGHAGDSATMSALIARCVELGVAVGAHPSYPDRVNFGRSEVAISLADLEASITDQLSALAAAAAAHNAAITHVKPHGALYHAASHPDVAHLIARAVLRVFPHRPALIGAASTPMLAHWAAAGFPVIAEGFADRRYEPGGTLRPRSRPGAVLHDRAASRDQAVSIARDRAAFTETGVAVHVNARTLCIHSDTPDAIAVAAEVRDALLVAGVSIARP